MYRQLNALALPLAVTHVCRRWRSVALDHAHLWTKVFWDAGDSVEAALAFLERSRNAPLTVNMAFETSRMSSDGLSVFGAVSAQFCRVTKLSIRMSRELIENPAISTLFAIGPTPLLIPGLRDLSIEVLGTHSSQDWPRLNIASPSLTHLYLGWVLPLSWGSVLSPSTTHVTLRSLVIQCGDLQQVLELAPNLHTLRMVLLHVVADTVKSPGMNLPSSSAGSARTVDSLQLHYVTGESLGFVQHVIPITTQIREVIVGTSFVNTPADVAFDFLHISDLSNITSLRLLPGDFSVSTASGLARAVQGDLTEELLERLYSLCSTQPILSTLREASVCISQWDTLLGLVFDSDVGNTLPSLERIVLSVGQDRFRFDEMSVGYDGLRIFLPRWTTLEVIADGGRPPTIDLVRYTIRALDCLQPTPLTSIHVEFSNRNTGEDDWDSEDDYATIFSELYHAETAHAGLGVSD
ncbi:hypothetical protein AURDEDRAFT_174509 [Auricularia subglabra TFB-10046 SS5]|uniref:Uncharacterized protein n=1 Tax=Auricularia subglabra (strain TFB-10046 / SS5) TaxID=717982 RepID=J0CYR5_AURST|nr:hypothetical protein AURDEDRAFT_174509 [Auricularia subglabra TFB-10046 SS5]